MPKVTSAKTNFTKGEFSPLLLGRFDIAAYANGAKKIENFLVLNAGGVTRRPGSYYVAEVKNSALSTRLIDFQFSTTQAYILEMGNLYFRFYTDQGQVQNPPAGALEITTPYTESQLFDVQYAQSEDVAYMVHGSHQVVKLERLSATSWQLPEVAFVRGPFLDDNITVGTIDPSADAGDGITLTASVDTFLAGHVGSLWRIKGGVVKITAFTNTKLVTGDVQAEPDGTAGALGTGGTPTTDWAEGAFSDVQGHPTSVTFHEGRLVFAKGQKIFASYAQSFENFAIGANAADAFIYKIRTEQVNAIRWKSSGPKALQVGTSGSTFSFSSGVEGAPITPTSIVVKRDTTYGSAKILPKRIGSFVYFIQRNLKVVRELGFDWDKDREQALDMTLLSDHITGDGIIDMSYQQAPNDILWCVRADGQMATLTRQIDQFVIGWARQIAGSDSRGPGVYESVAVVPIDEGDDEVWVIVKRYINGSYVRYIEFFMPREFDDQHDAFCVDSGLTLDSPIVITGATAADPVVITAAGHGLSNGDQVKIVDVVGMTELNDNFYLVANKDATTFQLTTLAGVAIDGSAFTAYISGGEIRKMVTTISGLTHLKGETVAVTADGAARTNKTVSDAGVITLTSKAAVVHVGLPYTPTIGGLPLIDGSATGTGAGKTRRIFKAIIRFYKTLGAQFGSEDTQDLISFLDARVPLGRATPLYTGLKEIDPDMGWDRLGEYTIIQSQPLPITILYIILLSEVNE